MYAESVDVLLECGRIRWLKSQAFVGPYNHVIALFRNTVEIENAVKLTKLSIERPTIRSLFHAMSEAEYIGL